MPRIAVLVVARGEYTRTDLETPEFIARLKSYDPEAFRELVRGYEDRIFNLALRLTRNVDEAEEVLQETLLSVFDKIQTFQERSRLSTWIYAIASNGALSRLRKKTETPVTFDDDVPLNTDSSVFRNGQVLFEFQEQDSVLVTELKEKLEAAIDSLPDGYRELFIMKELQKLSIKEIAGIVGIKGGAVKTRLHRARLLLRARLSDYWVDE
ncbi:MAG: RNA polymerase sigma factor [Spirochaetales bacterium]|nr:RNA polymerase sigma factor [Spirochaetales bacterium]